MGWIRDWVKDGEEAWWYFVVEGRREEEWKAMMGGGQLLGRSVMAVAGLVGSVGRRGVKGYRKKDEELSSEQSKGISYLKPSMHLPLPVNQLTQLSTSDIIPHIQSGDR